MEETYQKYQSLSLQEAIAMERRVKEMCQMAFKAGIEFAFVQIEEAKRLKEENK